MRYRAALVKIDVSEELIASIVSVKTISELATEARCEDVWALSSMGCAQHISLPVVVRKQESHGPTANLTKHEGSILLTQTSLLLRVVTLGPRIGYYSPPETGASN
jgi:hypothetical protein